MHLLRQAAQHYSTAHASVPHYIPFQRQCQSLAEPRLCDAGTSAPMRVTWCRGLSPMAAHTWQARSFMVSCMWNAMYAINVRQLPLHSLESCEAQSNMLCLTEDFQQLHQGQTVHSNGFYVNIAPSSIPGCSCCQTGSGLQLGWR